MRKEVTFICLAFSLILFTSVLVSANVVNVNLDKEYNVSLQFIDSSNARFVINGQNTKSLSEQNSPYQFYPYFNSEKIDNLNLIVSNIFYQAYVGGEHKAEVILAYKVNISEECTENWNCSAWSSCSNSQQTRTCTDLSSCGTTANKPIETQGCGSPNPNIECYNEEDCIMPSMGSPYCEDDKVCIGYLSYKCINPGTTASYCNSTSVKQCDICPNGCRDNICINQSLPIKECETIGLRESGKYCSSQYKLENQKSDGVSCENNFECKINSCLESKCGKEETSKLIYWIFGIVAVIILIGLVIYFLRPKSE